MNKIDKIRQEVSDYFDSSQLAENSREIFTSPDDRYRMETCNSHQNKEDVNWDVTKVEIYDNDSQEKLFEFFGNEGRFFHQWLTKNKVDYLICAEDLFGGQTVIDLTNQQMESFSPDEDGFIWTAFHLSPDGKKLATIGCYWACPYVIKVYDFQTPMVLPLTELNEIELINNTEEIKGWMDNENLTTDKRKTLNTAMTKKS